MTTLLIIQCLLTFIGFSCIIYATWPRKKMFKPEEIIKPDLFKGLNEVHTLSNRENIIKYFSAKFRCSLVDSSKILIEAEKRFSCTIQDLYDAARFSVVVVPDNMSLKDWVDSIGRISDFGIKGAEAGSQFATYFRISIILKESGMEVDGYLEEIMP